MPLRRACLVGLAAASLLISPASAQQTTPFGRLPSHVFEAAPPAARVAGTPGAMTDPHRCPAVRCRSPPRASASSIWPSRSGGTSAFRSSSTTTTRTRRIRRRQIEAAGRGSDGSPERRRAPSRIGTPEAARTAASIGGYWAVTPGGAWILEHQNEHWREAISGVTRWRFPWSAAFISWLMCEGGIGTSDAFQRAIAHHTYIDQAIRARDGASAASAYVAYDVGEAPIAPGDMLCSSRRPVFRSLAARRAQAGQGARTHCDVVGESRRGRPPHRGCWRQRAGRGRLEAVPGRP